jgi:protein-S-isoprenylcysteine O-methyltransferase Ste14
VGALELKIPPVVVGGLTAALMAALAKAAPAWQLEAPGAELMAALFMATGFGVALAGVQAFRRAETTVDPRFPERTSSFVAGGIYRCTRNPMYLGMALVLVGWAAALQHPLAFAGVPLFQAYMNRFQIEPEERHLRSKFGADFEDYVRNVRRWI